MPVHCSKCGEELLGAVNRCWKCGQKFAVPPEMDGRPPVRAAGAVGGGQTLEAIVADAAVSTPIQIPIAVPRVVQSRPKSTGDLVEARLAGQMAMGGTVTSVMLGVFAALLAGVWPPAAIIAVLGLVMGIWGLSSPRRHWALVGMLLCCLAIGLGTFGMVRKVYISMQQNKAVSIEEPNSEMEP